MSTDPAAAAVGFCLTLSVVNDAGLLRSLASHLCLVAGSLMVSLQCSRPFSMFDSVSQKYINYTVGCFALFFFFFFVLCFLMKLLQEILIYFFSLTEPNSLSLCLSLSLTFFSSFSLSRPCLRKQEGVIQLRANAALFFYLDFIIKKTIKKLS